MDLWGHLDKLESQEKLDHRGSLELWVMQEDQVRKESVVIKV